MEIISERKVQNLKAAIFDFDGTLSALRCGWEKIMLPLMTEYTSEEAENECKKYIDDSAGIQTIHQMKWLCEKVKECNNPKNAPLDPWFFKEEYNKRLIKSVNEKKKTVDNNPVLAEKYIIGGAVNFLKTLKHNGIMLFAASGTDEQDVINESKTLGLFGYFESVNGALPHSESCSKEAVITKLIKELCIPPESILICGDGKVEIQLGIQNNCITLGIASDEEKLVGFNKQKEQRLKKAGADAITGDFTELGLLTSWLSL